MKWKDGEPEEGSGTKRVVVCSHGCVCEDYDRHIEANQTGKARRIYVQVAPIRSITDFTDSEEKLKKVEAIKRGEVADAFYLYSDGKAFGDQVVDLTREQPIPAGILVRDCKRIARLADWQWNALGIHATMARFRVEAEKLFHPDMLKGAKP